MIPDNLVGLAQCQSHFTHNQLLKRSHEVFDLFIQRVSGDTIVTAGYQSQKMSVWRTVIRYSDSRVTGLAQQAEYVFQRMFRRQIRITGHKTGFKFLHFPHHFRLTGDGLRTEDKRESSVTRQLDGQFGTGNRLHDCRNERDVQFDCCLCACRMFHQRSAQRDIGGYTLFGGKTGNK